MDIQIHPYFVRKIVAPLWALKDRSRRFSYLKQLEKTQFLSERELKERQWRRLKSLLKHAYENTTYFYN